MKQLKKYLTKKGIEYSTVPEWSLIFGNDSDAIFVEPKKTPWAYLSRYDYHWEYRGNYTSVYISKSSRGK